LAKGSRKNKKRNLKREASNTWSLQKKKYAGLSFRGRILVKNAEVGECNRRGGGAWLVF